MYVNEKQLSVPEGAAVWSVLPGGRDWGGGGYVGAVGVGLAGDAGLEPEPEQGLGNRGGYLQQFPLERPVDLSGTERGPE